MGAPIRPSSPTTPYTETLPIEVRSDSAAVTKTQLLEVALTVQAATNFALFFATPALSIDGGRDAGRVGLAVELGLLLGTTGLGLASWAAFERRMPPPS